MKQKIPDYIINGIVNNKEYSKILVECKTFDGDSYYAILRQVLNSGLFTIGMIGDYTDEIRKIDNNTLELKFTGASQFILIIRGT